MKTVIFDFDGTIADTWSSIIKILKKKHEEWGLPEISQEMIDTFRNGSWLKLFRKYKFIIWKIPFIIPRVQKMLHMQMTRVPLFPGISDVVLQLKKKGFKLGILTTNTKENVQSLFRYQNLNLFDFIHSEMNLFGKDKSLKKIVEDNHLSLDETIYVGDEVRDIDACKEVGMKMIAVTWGFNSKEILKKSNPDYLVNSPKEILKIVI